MAIRFTRHPAPLRIKPHQKQNASADRSTAHHGATPGSQIPTHDATPADTSRSSPGRHARLTSITASCRPESSPAASPGPMATAPGRPVFLLIRLQRYPSTRHVPSPAGNHGESSHCPGYPSQPPATGDPEESIRENRVISGPHPAPLPPGGKRPSFPLHRTWLAQAVPRQGEFDLHAHPFDSSAAFRLPVLHRRVRRRQEYRRFVGVFGGRRGCVWASNSPSRRTADTTSVRRSLRFRSAEPLSHFPDSNCKWYYHGLHDLTESSGISTGFPLPRHWFPVE